MTQGDHSHESMTAQVNIPASQITNNPQKLDKLLTKLALNNSDPQFNDYEATLKSKKLQRFFLANVYPYDDKGKYISDIKRLKGTVLDTCNFFIDEHNEKIDIIVQQSKEKHVDCETDLQTDRSKTQKLNKMKPVDFRSFEFAYEYRFLQLIFPAYFAPFLQLSLNALKSHTDWKPSFGNTIIYNDKDWQLCLYNEPELKAREIENIEKFIIDRGAIHFVNETPQRDASWKF
eukprot:NODE_1511_length_910_cov_0.467324.p1 type:complete len:232 gc:universal NODE_1511_length_910_cov_0.467324:112-807(+)